MSHDPLEYIDSYNLYAFASLEPINFWDPWGLGADGLVNQKPKPKPEPKQVVNEPYFPDFSTLEPGGNPDDMPSNVKIDRQILEPIEKAQNPKYEVSGEIIRLPDGTLLSIIIPRDIQIKIDPTLQSWQALPPHKVRRYVVGMFYRMDPLGPLPERVAYFHTHLRTANASPIDMYYVLNSGQDASNPLPVLSLVVGPVGSSLYVPDATAMKELGRIFGDISNGIPVDSEVRAGSPAKQLFDHYYKNLKHTTTYSAPRGQRVFRRTK